MYGENIGLIMIASTLVTSMLHALRLKVISIVRIIAMFKRQREISRVSFFLFYAKYMYLIHKNNLNLLKIYLTE